MAYQMNIHKCLYLSTILNIQTVLAEEIEGKVYVDQDESLSDLKPPSSH